MASTGVRQKQFATNIPPTIVSVAERLADANVSKAAGYGLPCANCHLYYPADLDTCPTCHHHERISPKAAPLKRAEKLPDPMPDSAAVEQEREEFLRQFRSQLHPVDPQAPKASSSLCALSERHAGEEASAQICKTCYEHLHEKIENFETALGMDLKAAAQVIYNAVWADPSDPSKTYENAAAALLTELRKRAGMDTASNPSEQLTE
jgi:hypothetical protein